MPAVDKFANFLNSLTGSPDDEFDVVRDDATDLPFVTRSIMISTPGVIKATWKGGGTSISAPLLVGVQYSMRLTRVWLNGTTATGIKGQY